MDAQRYQDVCEAVRTAMELPEESRDAFLRERCGGDEALLSDARAMLADASAGDGASLAALNKVLRPVVESHTAGAHPAWPRIEGFEFVRELHRGGQGVVFQAIQKSTRRKVAVKVLSDGALASKTARRRFEREIQLVSQLAHSNIIAIHHSGRTEDGHDYCVMDYVRGDRLDDYVRKNDLSVNDMLRLFSQICDAVDYAHRKGIIHRDLKPSNILVDSNGVPKVLDFGLAKQLASPEASLVSMTGQVVGTLPYMSPEQAAGSPDEIDTRTDIYSLGVILYQLLTGQFPYDVGGSIRDVLENIVNAEPIPPGTIREQLDGNLDSVVLKALAKKREDRYQSASALSDSLKCIVAGKAVEGSKVPARKRGHKKSRNTASLSLAIAGISMLPFLLCAYLNTGHSTTSPSPLDEMGDTNSVSGAHSNANLAVEPIPDHKEFATVKINSPERPSYIDPIGIRKDTMAFVNDLIFERLFWRTDALDLVPNPNLVSSVDVSNYPPEIMIGLRNGARWHDGQEFTASDVEFSWRLAVSDHIDAGKKMDAQRLSSVRSIGKHKIAIEIDEAVAEWQPYANFELIPMHQYQLAIDSNMKVVDVELLEEIHRSQPVGCGPFFFERWEEQFIVLRRFDDYLGEFRPRIWQLEVGWIDSDAQRMSAFLSGDLDIFKLTKRQYEEDEPSRQFRQIGQCENPSGSDFYFLAWNCGDDSSVAIANAGVRYALSLAISEESIVRKLGGDVCSGPFPSKSKYADPTIKAIHDPRKAMARLDALGYPIVDEVRCRTEDGVLVQFEIKLLVLPGDPLAEEIAKLIRKQLGEVSVKATIVSSDSIPEGVDKRNEVSAVILRATQSVAIDKWRKYFSSGSKENWSRYKNPVIDKLFEEGATEQDERLRIKKYHDIHRLLNAEQPWTFLMYPPEHWAINKRIQGVDFSARGPYLFDPGIRRWWVKKN